MLMKPNLILGTINNYNFYQVSRFVYSLRKTDFDGHVCLYVGESVQDSTVRALRRAAIEVVRFNSDPGEVESFAAKINFPLPNPVIVNNFRYLFYYDYLKNSADRFGKVMLTDVRDVVFQSDPFDLPFDSGLFCAVEPKRITQCEVNSEWLKVAYGLQHLETFEDKKVICSGTTWGDVESVRKYLEHMLSEMSALPHTSNTIIDQAIHNELIYSGRIPRVKFLHNNDGTVMTLHHETKYDLDEGGFIVAENGKRVSVLHQYDRHPKLIRLIDKKIFGNPVKKGATKAYYSLLHAAGI